MSTFTFTVTLPRKVDWNAKEEDGRVIVSKRAIIETNCINIIVRILERI